MLHTLLKAEFSSDLLALGKLNLSETQPSCSLAVLTRAELIWTSVEYGFQYHLGVHR